MANATYALSITGTHFQQFVENVYHFQGDLATGAQPWTEGNDLIDAFRAGGETNMLACLPPTFRLDRYTARCVIPNGPGNNAHQQVVNDAAVGTSGTGAASENLCPVMNLIPPMGVKSQGRIYMPCIAKEDVNNNALQAGYIAAMTTYFDALIAGINNSATVWKLAVYSKKLTTSSLVLQHSLSAAIGYQGRRRRPL